MVIAVFLISLVALSLLAFLTLYPLPSQPFLRISTLGSDMMAQHYYPSDNPNIRIGENVTWYAQVYNDMGSVGWVSVRLKLGNSTSEGPNDVNNTPSSLPTLLEFTKLVDNNYTWTFPISWVITNTSRAGNAIVINDMQIDNYTLSGLNVKAISGFDFRIILELWVFDTQISQFGFSWESQGSAHSAWNEVWFNATSH